MRDRALLKTRHLERIAPQMLTAVLKCSKAKQRREREGANPVCAEGRGEATPVGAWLGAQNSASTPEAYSNH